jgi:hypothetical protein
VGGVGITCGSHLWVCCFLPGPSRAQVFVRILKSGVSGKDLNSSFEFRDTPEYKLELGNTIFNFVKVVSDWGLQAWGLTGGSSSASPPCVVFAVLVVCVQWQGTA